jgi:hypothetical protein
MFQSLLQKCVTKQSRQSQSLACDHSLTPSPQILYANYCHIKRNHHLDSHGLVLRDVSQHSQHQAHLASSALLHLLAAC